MNCSNRFRGFLCNRHSSSFHPNTSLLVDSDNWVEDIKAEEDEIRGNESDRVCLSVEAAEKTGYSDFEGVLCLCRHDIRGLNESLHASEKDDTRLKVIEQAIDILKGQQKFIKQRMGGGQSVGAS